MRGGDYRDITEEERGKLCAPMTRNLLSLPSLRHSHRAGFSNRYFWNYVTKENRKHPIRRHRSRGKNRGADFPVVLKDPRWCVFCIKRGRLFSSKCGAETERLKFSGHLRNTTRKNERKKNTDLSRDLPLCRSDLLWGDQTREDKWRAFSNARSPRGKAAWKKTLRTSSRTCCS